MKAKRAIFLIIHFLCFTYIIQSLSYGQSLTGRLLNKVDYLSPVEKDIILELNRARTNPEEYAETLKNFRKYYDGNLLKLPGKIPIRTSEGVRAVDEAIAYLRNMRPLPGLIVSQGMSHAAHDHVNDQGRTNKTGHKGSDGSLSAERLDRYGRWQIMTGENISYGSETAQDVVVQLIIDDGVSDRGHRKNIFTPQFRYCGVACGPHNRYRQMCVITFAGGFEEKK